MDGPSLANEIAKSLGCMMLLLGSGWVVAIVFFILWLIK